MRPSILITTFAAAFVAASPQIAARDKCRDTSSGATPRFPCTVGSYACTGTTKIGVCVNGGNSWKDTAYCGRDQVCDYAGNIPYCKNC